jgi:hypothetical protein
MAAVCVKGGCYNLASLADCIRLVLDSRPNRQRQEAMLSVIERTPGAPTRDEILRELKGETEECK